jgi:hypothetical protein
MPRAFSIHGAMVGSVMLRLLYALMLIAAIAAAAAQPSHEPSPEKPWTEHDYVDFYFAHFNGRLALPHLRDERSKPMFDRLVDPANLEAIRATYPDDTKRRLALDQVLAAVGAARASYYYAVRVGEPLSEELTRIQIFYLELLGELFALPGMPDLTATHPAWRTSLMSVVDALSERDIYSDKQTLKLARALADHFAAIAPVLRPGDGAALARQFEALGRDTYNADLQAAFARLAGIAAKS